MDPASVIGVIGVAAQIIKLTYQYGEAVVESRAEIALLRVQLFGLQAVLTQIEQDLHSVGLSQSGNSIHSALTSSATVQMMEATSIVLADLANILKDSLSRTRRLATQLAWPLRRANIREKVAHLERLKTYFILAVANDTMHLTRETMASLGALQMSLETTEQDSLPSKAYADAVEWLGPCESAASHAAAISTRLRGTNLWFLEDHFDSWLTTDVPMLWLYGMPGSGKTHTIAASIDRLEHMKTPVAYFYCSHNDVASQDAKRILASLIEQLSRQDANARARLVQEFKVSPSRPTLSLLMSLLSDVIKHMAQTPVIAVDALDECGDSLTSTIEALFSVLQRNKGSKFLFSSRDGPESKIRTCLLEIELSACEVSMQLDQVKADIDRYICAAFDKQPVLLKLSPTLRSYAIKTLQSQHKGSFRWIQCMVDDLGKQTTPRAIQKALQGISRSLSDIYLQMLRSIASDLKRVAILMLQYLVSSLRPLYLAELAEAVSFTLADAFDEDDRLIDPEEGIRQLRSLVRYNSVSKRFELAHSSVRSFLHSSTASKEYYIDPSCANTQITQACVDYLALPAFRNACEDFVELQTRKNDWPFFEYASLYWSRHAKTPMLGDKAYLQSVKDFMATSDLPRGGNFASWYQCIYPIGGKKIWETRPLYMCAREGLVAILSTLLARCTKDELEERGGSRGSTALHVAATYGETEALKLLIAAGADPNEQNDFGESGIQWAAFYSHDAAVRLLLDSGAHPDLLDRTSQSATFEQMAQHTLVPSTRHAGSSGEEEEEFEP